MRKRRRRGAHKMSHWFSTAARFGTVLLLLLQHFSSSIVSAYRLLEDRVTPYDDDIEKGDRDCNEIGALWNYSNGDVSPCEHGIDGNVTKGDDDENSSPPPPSPPEAGPVFTNSPVGPPSGLADTNQVTINVYVALKEGQRSLAGLVTRLLTEYVNQTDDSNFVMHNLTENPPIRRRRKRKLQSQKEEEDGVEESIDTNSTGPIDMTLTNETANFSWWDMYYVTTDPDNLQHASYTSVWWWSYAIRYSCFWGNSIKPVKNATVLTEVTVEMTNIIATGVETGDFDAWLHRTYPSLAAKDFEISTEPPGPPYETDDYFTRPLDPGAWDWRRYLGLGVLCATILVTAVLMQLAAYRHRRLYKHECWSNVNLGNEKGVEEMLNMGWKLKGAQMEIYDKTTLGYTDDNSLFLGGYEQREPGGLCEITVTHPTEEASETHVRPE